MAEAVVVGVRVRPFNDREKGLKAVCCIEMNGPTTTINDEEGTPTHFTFDQSFWSHDGSEDDGTGYQTAKPGSNYADQRYVFDTFGQRVLDNAWAGYHCCLFAYGQTGAGKSYSMVGYGINKGIVPMSCDEIFNRISANKDPDKRYEVMVSMLEIYNETVQDLFIPFDKRPKNGLQIRESKAMGIYVDGIIKSAVDSYPAIEKCIDQGTSNRSVGSTAMNATSSRAHTVITIEFRQVETIQGKECVKLSNINLVDLAGSEKAGQTGAKGDRLKEGMAINKSLSALGNVIEKLAERSQNPKNAKNIQVPYRDSKLTRLLQNALGGSSKTIMICALSPASSNYEETLSTLRYADRAKKIKNVVTVNENPQEKLMREMREENAKLKALLEGAGIGSDVSGGGAIGEGGGAAINSEEVIAKKAELARMEQELQEQMKSFQEKLADTKSRDHDHRRGSGHHGNVGIENVLLMNVNLELELSGKIRYCIYNHSTATIGGHGASLARDDSDDGSEEDSDVEEEEAPEILLGAEGVNAKHAKIQNVERRCFLTCEDEKSSKTTWINGVSVADLLSDESYTRGEQGEWEKKEEWRAAKGRGPGYLEGDPPGILLQHCDRVVFGKGIFLFVDPLYDIPEMLIMAGEYSYTKCRKELPTDWSRAVKDGGQGLQTALRKAVVANVAKLEEGEEEGSKLSKGLGGSVKAAAFLKRMQTFKKPGDKEATAAAADDDVESLTDAHEYGFRKDLEAKDKELAELREKLAASEAATQKAQESAAEERAEKEKNLAEKLRLEEAERTLRESQAKAESEAEAAQTKCKATVMSSGAQEARARLDEAILRLQGAMSVARGSGVDASVVATADAKLETFRKNMQITEALHTMWLTGSSDNAFDLKIMIQKAKSVHGIPVDRTLIGRCEERLKAWQDHENI